MSKYQMMIIGERMSDLLAISQLAEEKSLTFGNITLIESDVHPKTKRGHHAPRQYVDGKPRTLIAMERLLDAFSMSDEFASKDKRILQILANLGLSASSSSALVSHLRAQGRVGMTQKGLWQIISKEKKGLKTSGYKK